MTSTPTRPVDNVVIATKGLQDRNINILDGMMVENKGKLILSGYKTRRRCWTVIRVSSFLDWVAIRFYHYGTMNKEENRSFLPFFNKNEQECP